MSLVSKRWTRVVLVLRTLRLIRLFSNIRRFRVIFASALQLVPVFSALFGTPPPKATRTNNTNLTVAMYVCVCAGVLVFQYFFFGLIAVRLFGGLIYVGAPELKGSAFEAGFYFPNSFNDFGSTCVVLFDLMVVNNWYDASLPPPHEQQTTLTHSVFFFPFSSFVWDKTKNGVS